MLHLNSFILGIVTIIFMMLIVIVIVGMVKIKNLISSRRDFENQFSTIYNEFQKLENNINISTENIYRDINDTSNNMFLDLNNKIKTISSELDSKFDKLNHKINSLNKQDK